MPKGENRHLTIEDRVRVEKGLDNKESFASIARAIGVSTSTVSRGVKPIAMCASPRGAGSTCASARGTAHAPASAGRPARLGGARHAQTSDATRSAKSSRNAPAPC